MHLLGRRVCERSERTEERMKERLARLWAHGRPSWNGWERLYTPEFSAWERLECPGAPGNVRLECLETSRSAGWHPECLGKHLESSGAPGSAWERGGGRLEREISLLNSQMISNALSLLGASASASCPWSGASNAYGWAGWLYQ